jgi:hypothetical protein
MLLPLSGFICAQLLDLVARLTFYFTFQDIFLFLSTLLFYLRL